MPNRQARLGTLTKTNKENYCPCMCDVQNSPHMSHVQCTNSFYPICTNR